MQDAHCIILKISKKQGLLHTPRENTFAKISTTEYSFCRQGLPMLIFISMTADSKGLHERRVEATSINLSLERRTNKDIITFWSSHRSLFVFI